MNELMIPIEFVCADSQMCAARLFFFFSLLRLAVWGFWPEQANFKFNT